MAVKWYMCAIFEAVLNSHNKGYIVLNDEGKHRVTSCHLAALVTAVAPRPRSECIRKQ